jgi:hypothetical protein
MRTREVKTGVMPTLVVPLLSEQPAVTFSVRVFLALAFNNVHTDSSLFGRRWGEIFQAFESIRVRMHGGHDRVALFIE